MSTVIVYKPPSYNDAQNVALIDVLKLLVCDREVIIVGDFNLPDINWSSVTSISLHRESSLPGSFLELFRSCGLIQWVTQPTYPRSGNTLDLLLTTDHDRIGDVCTEAPLPACDHCPVLFDYVFETGGELEETVPNNRLAWHKGNYTGISEVLSLVDWDFEFAYLNVTSSYDKFVEIVSDVVKEHVPVKTLRPRSAVPWKVTPPGSLVRDRQHAWQAYKDIRRQSGRRSNDALEAYSKFCSLNRQCRSFAVSSQARYEAGLIDAWRDNPKLFHAYVRSKKTAPATVGPLRLPGGQVSGDLSAPHHGRDRHSNIPLQVQPTKAAIVVTSDADPNEKQYFRYLSKT